MVDPTVEEKLLEELREVRVVAIEENRKRDVRIRSNHRAMRWSRVTSSVAIAVAIVAASFAWSARSDLHAFRRATHDARIASCWQDRHRSFGQRAAEKKEIRQLSALSTAPQPAVAKFLAGYDSTVDSGHSIRVCTPEAVAAYLAKKGP